LLSYRRFILRHEAHLTGAFAVASVAPAFGAAGFTFLFFLSPYFRFEIFNLKFFASQR
jgi:hypothetical protein